MRLSSARAVQTVNAAPAISAIMIAPNTPRRSQVSPDVRSGVGCMIPFDF
jgi:hypothetical protein